MSPDGEHQDDVAIEWETRVPTLAENCGVSILGWENDNEGEAREFAQRIWAWAHGLSRYLDLSRLEKIVVAWDYAKALADINLDDSRETPPATPTSNEYGEGGAMALHVVRSGELWNVVVIAAPLVRPLLDETDPSHDLALQTLVHELMHVDDLRLFTRTFPGGWRAAASKDAREATLHKIVSPCQSEYSAQRRSAWAAPEFGFEYLKMLEGALRDAEDKIREARLSYRVSGDLDTYWPIVTERATFLFQALGYALGHADWAIDRREEDPELADRYEARLRDLSDLPNGWLIEACREAVLPIYRQTEWTSLEVFDELVAVGEQFLNEHGMFTRLENGQLYVDMPYTGFQDL